MAPAHSPSIEQAPVIEPDVERLMKIRPLAIPKEEEFEGVIKAEDIPDLGLRDQRSLLAISALEQWQNWTVNMILTQNHQMRAIESDSIRFRKRFWMVVRWTVTTVLAAAISAAFRYWFGK